MRRSRREREARRARNAWWGGLILSVAVHALAFLLWPSARIFLDDLRAESPRGFERTEPVRILELPRPQRPSETAERPVVPRTALAVRRAATPTPTLDLTRVEPVAARSPAMRSSARGEPTAPEGLDERYVQPIARAILPDWRAPRSLHGVVVTARVYVDEAGRPTGLVELVPPTPDREVNREIVYQVRRLDYQPAQRNGSPVAAWAEVTFVFCRTGVTATSPAPAGLSRAPCIAES